MNNVTIAENMDIQRQTAAVAGNQTMRP